MIKNIPGIAVIILLYLFAIFLKQITQSAFKISVFPLSFICFFLGILVFNFLPISQSILSGKNFIKKNILQFAIILLGLKISLIQVLSISAQSVLLIVITMTLISLTYYVLSKIFPSDKKLIGLIGIGTAICGITAILTSSSVLKSKEQDISQAVIIITLWGSFALISYPFLIEWVFVTDIAKGIFLGIGIHDTSQVIAAGIVHNDIYQNERVLEIATITKLFRNLFLTLLIPALVFINKKHNKNQSTDSQNLVQVIMQTIPLFVIGFLLLIIFRTIGDFYYANLIEWELFLTFTNKLVTILFALALTALGSSIDIKKIYIQGFTSISIGLIYSLVVLTSLLVMINLFQLN